MQVSMRASERACKPKRRACEEAGMTRCRYAGAGGLLLANCITRSRSRRPLQGARIQADLLAGWRAGGLAPFRTSEHRALLLGR